MHGRTPPPPWHGSLSLTAAWQRGVARLPRSPLTLLRDRFGELFDYFVRDLQLIPIALYRDSKDSSGQPVYYCYTNPLDQAIISKSDRVFVIGGSPDRFNEIPKTSPRVSPWMATPAAAKWRSAARNSIGKDVKVATKAGSFSGPSSSRGSDGSMAERDSLASMGLGGLRDSCVRESRDTRGVSENRESRWTQRTQSLWRARESNPPKALSDCRTPLSRPQ